MKRYDADGRLVEYSGLVGKCILSHRTQVEITASNLKRRAEILSQLAEQRLRSLAAIREIERILNEWRPKNDRN